MDHPEELGRAALESATSTEPARWHGGRHRTILLEHPEVRRLFGVDGRSALWVMALAAAQVSIAVSLRHSSPWWVVVAVLFVGAPIAHALGVLIHECAHNLVFRVTWMNKALALVANLGMGFPGAMTFRHRHLLHHRYLGDAREPEGRDTQAPTLGEVELGGRSSWRKLICFSLGHFIFKARESDRPPLDRWLVANVASCLLALVGLTVACGLRSTSYVVVSLFFAFGPHPLGARRASEHLTLRRGQPTCSYYGVLNCLAFNVGHHVEHHDFPYVPWSRLRSLRATASRHYDTLATVPSWTALLGVHLFDARHHRGMYVGVTDDYLESESSMVLAASRSTPRDPPWTAAAQASAQPEDGVAGPKDVRLRARLIPARRAQPRPSFFVANLAVCPSSGARARCFRRIVSAFGPAALT